MERHERGAFSLPVAGKPVRAAFDGGRLTSDAGVLLLAEIEGRPDGLAERHWLEAEREVTKEAENAAVSRWAAPVSGTYVERSNETAGIAGKAREAAAAARESAAER